MSFVGLMSVSRPKARLSVLLALALCRGHRVAAREDAADAAAAQEVAVHADDREVRRGRVRILGAAGLDVEQAVAPQAVAPEQAATGADWHFSPLFRPMRRL